VIFMTNSDRRKFVRLPHAFVAALHVQMANPRFESPTRDILIADDVREFVRDTALSTLPAQWAALRARRAVSE